MCPSEDELGSVARPGGDAGARARVLDHLDTCAACRRVVVELVREASTAPGVTAAIAPDPGAIGRYRIDGALGAGAMGVVFAAYDPELDRRVALKLLHRERGRDAAELEQRLLGEARALAKLAHPNVIAAFDVGRHDGEVFLAMELVDGVTLATWLDTAPRSAREIARAFAQVASGLAAAHATGLVHRDVKPDNLLVGGDGRVRVTDFGLASSGRSVVRDGGVETDAVAVTRTGALIGTPAYMAPEQLRGAPATAASDQYALSVALWEALHGGRPFGGATITALLTAQAGEPRTHGRRVSARLRAVARRGLAVDPAARWPDVAALATALDAIAAPPRPRRWIAAGLAGAAAAAALVLATRGSDAAPSCDGGGALIAPLWTTARAAPIERAFTAASPASAARAFAAVDDALSRYRADWAAERDDACRATHVRRAQSLATLEARTRCLDLQRREVDTFAGLLARADAPLVERAAGAATELPAPGACARAQAGDDPRDRDPAAVAIEERLADARAKNAAGLREAAYADADAATRDAEAQHLDHARLHALLERTAAGQLLPTIGMATAMEDARKASELALVLHDDASLSRAFTALTWIAVRAGDLAQAQTFAAIANAAIARRGGDPDEAADVAIAMCVRASRLGRDFVTGTQTCLDARRLTLASRREPEVRASWCDTELGNIAYATGRYAESIDANQRGIDVIRRHFGEPHPSSDAGLANQADALLRLGRDADATPRIDGVMARHPDWPAIWILRSHLRARAHDDAGATADAQRAAEIARAADDRQELQDALDTLGEAHVAAGRFTEAAAAFEEARALTVLTPLPSDAARAELGLARVAAHAGDTRARAAHVAAARAVLGAAGVPPAGPAAEVGAAIDAFSPR